MYGYTEREYVRQHGRYHNIFQHVPDDPDSTERYLFYLHGLLVEEAGICPKSHEHGYYEYELILEALAKGGFIGAYISTMLREKDVNYVFLACLFEKYLDDEKRCVAKSIVWPGEEPELPSEEFRLAIGKKVFGDDYSLVPYSIKAVIKNKKTKVLFNSIG